MSEDRLQKLIATWDAGQATAEEEAELERLLDGDAGARQTFAHHYVQEAELFGVLREADGFKQGEQAPLPSFQRDWRPRWLRSPGQALVAGFLIMAMGGILFLTFSSPSTPAPQPILVDNKEVDASSKETRIEVEPGAPKTVQLPDDRQLTFVVPERPDDLSKSFFRLLGLAKAQVPAGVPIEAEFEREDGKHRFTADFLQGSKKIEIHLDAETDELLDTDSESADSKDRALNLEAGDLSRAVMRALEAHRGMTVSAEIESRGRRPEAKVRIARGGELITVQVDVKTGKILKARHRELEDDSDHDDD